MAWRLRTQIALLVLGVLFVAQALSLWFFVDERSLAVQAAIGAEAAGRAANVAQLVEGAPADLHAQIIQAATSPLVRFDLSDEPSVAHGNHDDGGAVEARVRALLGDSYSRDIRVEVHEIEQGLLPLPNLSPEMAEMHAEMMQGSLAAIEMELSIALAGGDWLNVGTRFERPPLQWSTASNVSFVLTATLLLLASFWFLLTRLTGPLNTLADASERLGRGAGEGSLPVVGPCSVCTVSVPAILYYRHISVNCKCDSSSYTDWSACYCIFTRVNCCVSTYRITVLANWRCFYLCIARALKYTCTCKF